MAIKDNGQVDLQLTSLVSYAAGFPVTVPAQAADDGSQSAPHGSWSLLWERQITGRIVDLAERTIVRWTVPSKTDMLLTDFDALTFDCYGTLIDWESGIIEALIGLTDRVQRPLTREQSPEAHARHESSQQRYTPAKLYRDLLPIVYKRLAEEWNAWRPNAHLHPSPSNC